MFESNFGFSDSIEIVPSIDEQEEKNSKTAGPIILNEVKNEPKAEKKDEKKDEKNNVKDVQSRSRNNKKVEDVTSKRRESLYAVTSSLYVDKFDDYADVPDFIVNQIFDIDDGKGTITIEEAIIMLINLFPNTRDKINQARMIEDAIKIGKKEIVEHLYRECRNGFSNIPVHSRENLSNKITSDIENDNYDASLYDYQMMRISGYIK